MDVQFYILKTFGKRREFVNFTIKFFTALDIIQRFDYNTNHYQLMPL